MIQKIDHIGIVVKDLNDALKTYEEVFGLKVVKKEQLKTMNVEIAFVQTGEVLIELLQPKGPDSGMIGEFLTQNGEGFHHIALRVPSIDKAMERAKQFDMQFQNDEPQDGADESRIAFIEPECTQNVFTELVERKKEVGQSES